MCLYVIWLDREKGKLFQFSDSKMERQQFQSHHFDHHTHRLDQLDHAHQEKPLFRDIASAMTGAAKLLILGPGIAKYHFQNFLMEQEPVLAKKIVGCETVDHPSDAQIAAWAKRYFNPGSSQASG